MGNSDSRHLEIKNRLLEKQLNDYISSDSELVRKVLDTKKTRNYDSLILPGGGLSSLWSVKVLDNLSKFIDLSKINSIGASSFSSIVAVFFSIGVPLGDIKKIVTETNWTKIFKDKTIKTHSDIYHIDPKCGETQGCMFDDMISEIIEKYTGNRHYTIGEVYDDKNIELVIPVCDITNKKIIYFNHCDHRDLPLRMIIRAACSIPFVMCPIIFDSQYLCDTSSISQCFPYLFDSYQKDNKIINPNTLIVRFVRNGTQDLSEINTVNDFGKNLIELSSSNADKFLSKEDLIRIINIYVNDTGILSTNIGSVNDQSVSKCIESHFK
jgi:predicted acylesterase/phospholipase RssA